MLEVIIVTEVRRGAYEGEQVLLGIFSDPHKAEQCKIDYQSKNPSCGLLESEHVQLDTYHFPFTP